MWNAKRLRAARSSHHLLWSPLWRHLGVQSVPLVGTGTVSMLVLCRQRQRMDGGTPNLLKETWEVLCGSPQCQWQEKADTALTQTWECSNIAPLSTVSISCLSSSWFIHIKSIYSGFHTASNWNKFWIVALLRDSGRWNEGCEACSRSNATKLRKATVVLCGWETHFVPSTNWLKTFVRCCLWL